MTIEPSVYWLFHIVSAVFSAIVAVAVGYGVYKTKQKQFEKDISALQVEVNTAKGLFSDWVSDRKHTVRTIVNCHDVQQECQSRFCAKIDNLMTKYEDYGKENRQRWTNLSALLGAICQKLEIDIHNLTLL